MDAWVEVEQVPDSRGWIRIPPELLPSASRLPGLVATPRADGLLLRPGTVGPQAWPGTLSRPPAVLSAEPSIATPDDGPRLELIKVAAAYPGRPLFSDLELSLRGGELLAVIGPSGSGKSTLLSLAAGILDPSPVRSGWAATTGLTGIEPNGRDSGATGSPSPPNGRSWSNR